MFLTVEFDKKYKRDTFSCKHATLNNYLQFQATKESKAGLARIYLLINENAEVIGYYTLSSAELPRDSVPEDLLKKLPQSYSGYPAILLGRLALTTKESGKGLGGQLIVDALHRCVMHSMSIGTSVIMVDPIDEDAKNFYAKYMFKPLPDANRMILRIDHNLRAHFGIHP
ncbi:MAG: GNAT family N-acetyltransferase [Cyclobacteriaceae bacterium]|nr:GNAT family N-acetyltransferase [Cyclobacteriaceae bacterium SS2]